MMRNHWREDLLATRISQKNKERLNEPKKREEGAVRKETRVPGSIENGK